MITRAMILDSFKTVRSHTIQIAQDIPEAQYGHRPAEGAQTILEIFLDIIRIPQFMVESAVRPEFIEVTRETREQVFNSIIPVKAEGITTQAQVVKALEDSLASIVARVESVDEAFLNTMYTAPDRQEKLRLWVINCAKEQEMIRRAQLFLAERQIGITPHTTRRQQAAAAMANKP
ncbi:MAG: hypothetical protein SFY68_08435, partial [Candidatus Sumerlaeia bacterium]|nr:hypothetical protein [Candidatus Sumerlaeia bacterium]